MKNMGVLIAARKKGKPKQNRNMNNILVCEKDNWYLLRFLTSEIMQTANFGSAVATVIVKIFDTPHD